MSKQVRYRKYASFIRTPGRPLEGERRRLLPPPGFWMDVMNLTAYNIVVFSIGETIFDDVRID